MKTNAKKQKKTNTAGSKRSPRSATESNAWLSPNRSRSTRNRRALPNLNKSPVAAISKLHGGVQDNGIGSGNSNHWNRSSVESTKSEKKIRTRSKESSQKWRLWYFDIKPNEERKLLMGVRFWFGNLAIPTKWVRTVEDWLSWFVK